MDLYIGKQTRSHADLDVGVLRRDLTELVSWLPGWEIFEASNGMLTELNLVASPKTSVNSLWCRPAGSTLWALELLLDEGDHDTWRFRRNPSISRSLDSLVRRTPTGIPYLAPEIQLLYKAKSPRPRDNDDFARVASLLQVDERTWLRHALQTVAPSHEWIGMLS